VEDERFGELITIDLLPGGGDIPVTEENKKEWVLLKVEFMMLRRVQEQYAALMEGIHDFVPKNLLSVFDEREVELLIGGIAQSTHIFTSDYSKSDIFFSRCVCVQLG
jgi:E3 ubiquitin-protein ligase NEDD4